MTKILGPTQPSSALPVIRVGTKTQNVTTFTDSGGNTARILNSIPLGPIGDFMLFWLWMIQASANLSVQTLATTWKAQVSIRDATVQPTVTIAQFIASTPNVADIASFAGGVAPPIVGTNNFQTAGPYKAITASHSDEYGNAIAPGDSLVADFGVWLNQNKANQTGTFNASAWFTAINP